MPDVTQGRSFSQVANPFKDVTTGERMKYVPPATGQQPSPQQPASSAPLNPVQRPAVPTAPQGPLQGVSAPIPPPPQNQAMQAAVQIPAAPPPVPPPPPPSDPAGFYLYQLMYPEALVGSPIQGATDRGESPAFAAAFAALRRISALQGVKNGI